MKLYHFSILFSILFLAAAGRIAWQDQYAREMEREKRILERGVERAVDMAAGRLAVYCDGRLRMDRGQVMESFLNTLYAGLGVLEFEPARRKVLEGLLFFLIVSEDGICIWHGSDFWGTDWEGVRREKPEEPGETAQEEAGEVEQKWAETSEAEQEEACGGRWEEICWEDCGLSAGSIEEEKVKILEEILNWAAGQYEKAVFQLPLKDACLWLRGVDGPCVMAFWHGEAFLPAGHLQKEQSRFFSGAVVHKKYS